MSVIFTVFAGRKGNLKLLFDYVNDLLDKGSVSEFHVWNYTKDEIVDEPWLKRNIRKDPRVKLFEVKDKNKGFDEYYEYYTPDKFGPDDVIIKSDDDIVFIDTDQFDSFVERRRKLDKFVLVFPSIINNKACAQAQREFGLLDPKEFTNENIEGLWTNATIAEFLHQSFINNFQKFIEKSRKDGGDYPVHLQLGGNEIININFFAILAKDLGIFQQAVGRDDEQFLSRVGFHYMDMSMVVSHLAFAPQRSDGFNNELFQIKYRLLKEKFASIVRNGGSDCPDD